MRYAETGYALEIDLSKGSVERVETDPRDTELYLGGLGFCAKIIWDRVPPEVDPFSPESILIFSTGLLDATPAPAANRVIISAISPQTRLMGFSMIGGYWGPELKRAGYDRIIIKGRAPELVYIWINNDKVEIREASHLKGKSTYETQRLIREELKEPRAQILSIGLAGENKVYFASIEAEGNSSSRLGMGAVMGSKNLKAIAVRGTKDIYIAEPEKFIEQCNEVLRYMKYRMENPIKGVDPQLAYLGASRAMHIHEEKWHLDNFAWGNARVRRKGYWTPEVDRRFKEALEKFRKRLLTCYNCPVKCRGLVEIPGYPYSFGMKCFSKLSYMVGAMVDDPEFDFKIAALAQSYGVDAFTAPQVMAFAIELYEAGILTDADLPGFPSNNADRFFYLLDKIVRREGIGDILADGVYWAARKIGRGAEEYDHNTIRKHEQVPIKLGVVNLMYYLLWSTGEKGNITQIEGQIPQAPLPKELAEEFVRDWIQVPTGKEERFKRFILEWMDHAKDIFWPSIDLICELVEWQETMHYIDDCTGICTGVSSFAYKPPYHIHNIPLFISYGTGMEIDENTLWETAARVRNLVRANNIIRGLRREDEEPPKDHWKKRFPEYEQKVKDEYYKFRGWNKDGIPTKETLHKLKLDYVYEDFVKRGILKEDGE